MDDITSCIRCNIIRNRWKSDGKSLFHLFLYFCCVQISTSSAVSGVKPLFKISARATAVSRLVRQGMPSSTDLRRTFTLSRAGVRPFLEVEMM